MVLCEWLYAMFKISTVLMAHCSAHLLRGVVGVYVLELCHRFHLAGFDVNIITAIVRKLDKLDFGGRGETRKPVHYPE